MIAKALITSFFLFQNLASAFTCSAKNITGRYSMSLSGTGLEQHPPSIIPFVGPVVGIGIARLYADGKLQLIEHLNGAGQIIEDIVLEGKYHVNSNCLGQASAVNTFNKKEHTYKFVVSNQGQKIYLIMTYPTSPVILSELARID